jgi:YesN/AraC family two-component response regulator
MRYNTILIAFIILICGVTVSYIISRRVYKPIENILKKFTVLEREKSKSITVTRMKFLKDVLFDKYGSDIESLESGFKNYSVRLDPRSSYILVYLEVDDYFSFCSEHEAKKRDIIKENIISAASVNCTEFFNHEVLDLEKDNIVLIIDCGHEKSESKAEEKECFVHVEECIKKTQEVIRNKYKISISATVSGAADGAENLSSLYEEVLEFSNYRLFEGKECIIRSDNIQVKSAEEYTYSISGEKELVEALMLGKIERAKATLLDIINSTRGYSYTVLNMCVQRVFAAVHSAATTIRRNSSGSISLNLGSFLAAMKHCDTVDDIVSEFNTLFDVIAEHIERTKNNKHIELINRVSAIISEEYCDPNLSLNTIADSVNMSATYLGRVIKKTKRESVSDMINNYRLDMAKDLLEKTQKPVHDITETVGISNEPYFYTLFKKRFGITPSEYRKNIEDN